MKGLNQPAFLGDKPLDHLFQEADSYLNSSVAFKSYNERKEGVLGMVSFLDKIQILSIEQEQENAKRVETKSIVSISLHDLKIFGELLNRIVTQGFYACIPAQYAIPIGRRNLKGNIDRISRISIVESLELLPLLIASFSKMLKRQGDVARLLSRGTGFVDVLMGCVYLLSTSETDEKLKSWSRAQIIQLEKSSETFELYVAYTSIITPQSRAFVSHRLAHIPIERTADGVRSLIEFIADMRDEQDISVEKVDKLSQILLAKPADVSSFDYWTEIGSQVVSLLRLMNRPVLVSVICHFLNTLYDKNGLIVRDFFFKRVWERLIPESNACDNSNITDAINVASNLCKRTSPPAVADFSRPLIVPLWSQILFLAKNKLPTELVLDILVSMAIITDEYFVVDNIVRGFLITGGEQWQYSLNDGSLCISPKPSTLDSASSNEQLFDTLDVALVMLGNFLPHVPKEHVLKLFLNVFRRWLGLEGTYLDENPIRSLTDVRILELVAENFSELLSTDPNEIMQVVLAVLSQHRGSSPDSDKDSDDEGEDEEDSAINFALQLTSFIVQEMTKAKTSSTTNLLLEKIDHALEKVDTKSAGDLRNEISKVLSDQKPTSGENEQDVKVLDRAMLNLYDPVVPIKANGLYMLRKLVEEESKVINSDRVVILHLSNLDDPDPFIYLNVIKGLESLLSRNGHAVTKVIDSYCSNKAIDYRLKAGEVLSRFTENTSFAKLDCEVNIFMSSLLSMLRATNNQDQRIRMSSMSIIGIFCRNHPNLMAPFILDILDCILGILKMEISPDEAIIRRSAVWCCHDIISNGLGAVDQTLRNNLNSCLIQTRDTDSDYLVREQAEVVLSEIHSSLSNALIPKMNEKLNI